MLIASYSALYILYSALYILFAVCCVDITRRHHRCRKRWVVLTKKKNGNFFFIYYFFIFFYIYFFFFLTVTKDFLFFFIYVSLRSRFVKLVTRLRNKFQIFCGKFHPVPASETLLHTNVIKKCEPIAHFSHSALHCHRLTLEYLAIGVNLLPS